MRSYLQPTTLAILLVLLSACASRQSTPDDYLTRETPAGWQGDFDYSSPIGEYLARQYQIAEAAGKPAYIYFYADWCPPCIRLRHRAEAENMSAMFAKRHIVMINFDYIQDLYSGRAPIPGVPAFVRLDSSGRPAMPMITGGAWRDAARDDDFRKLSEFFETAESAVLSDN